MSKDMKSALPFLFLLSVTVVCAQTDSLLMFVKTTEPADTVYMTRADIDSILVEQECLLMGPSWMWEPISRKDTTEFSKHLPIPQFFPVKDSTYQPDNEGKIFRFHRPEKYDYHTLTQLGAEWPATAVTNSEVVTPSMQKTPSLQMDGIFTYQLGFSGNTLTYIVLDDCFGIITKYGRITPGDVLPKGYPVRHVKKIASWGYRMPLGKGWYARFDERPQPGVEVVSIFKFQFK